MIFYNQDIVKIRTMQVIFFNIIRLFYFYILKKFYNNIKGQLITLPYIISAVLSPIIGFMADKIGKR